MSVESPMLGVGLSRVSTPPSPSAHMSRPMQERRKQPPPLSKSLDLTDQNILSNQNYHARASGMDTSPHSRRENDGDQCNDITKAVFYYEGDEDMISTLHQ